MPRGFWTDLSAPATVDWCEPNYVHSVLVAEWWNTLSSLPIASLGVVALAWSLGSPWRTMPRFTFASVVLVIVGLGSAAFHGTLLRIGQALDELPMVYAGLTFLFVILAREAGPHPRPELARRLAWARAGLFAFAIAFTAAYIFFERWFVFFIVAYAFLVAMVVIRTGALSLGGATPAQSVRRRLFLLSAGSYVGGVVLLWLPEHVLLPCDHPFQAFHLHAWFHLTSAIGSYAWLVWAAFDRADLDEAVEGASAGFRPRVRSYRPSPTCR